MGDEVKPYDEECLRVFRDHHRLGIRTANRPGRWLATIAARDAELAKMRELLTDFEFHLDHPHEDTQEQLVILERLKQRVRLLASPPALKP